MTLELSGFKWGIPLAGFRWVDAAGVSFTELTTQPSGVGFVPSPPGTNRGYRFYHPDHENPALFLEFASLPPRDESAVIRFAHRYGLLGSCGWRWGRRLGQVVSVDGEWPPIFFEPHSEWAWRIVTLHHAHRVHLLLREGNTKALAEFIESDTAYGHLTWLFRTPFWFDPDLRKLCDPHEAGLDHRLQPTSLIGTADSVSGDDPVALARLWLDKEIGAHLYEGVRLGFSTNPNTGRQTFDIRPVHLLSMMWFQFARASAGGREHRACRECGKWFELVPQDKGRKVFCTTSCKLKDYRKRKNQAEELKTAGRTPKQIAEQTGTDLETVKKWVGSKKTGGGK